MTKRKTRRQSPNQQKPEVIFQPQTYRSWQLGVDQVVDAIAPTLGPLPRAVLYDTTVGTEGRLPEVLDDGGTIARRIIQIADRDADVGAMLLRQMLWRQHEKHGDGTATAAVLFQSVYNEGVRFLAAGGNAMRLRRHLEDGMRLILDQLGAMQQPLEGREALTQLAYTISAHEQLAKYLGEIFDIIGEYGRLEVRTTHGREIEREYVEGMYWRSALLSRSMINNPQSLRGELENAPVLATDLDIDDPQDLVPLLSLCTRMQAPGVLLIARRLSEVALGMLALNRQKGRIKVELIAAKTPGGTVDAQQDAVNDIALLTGGKPLLRSLNDNLRDVKPEHVGRARRVWVDRETLSVVGGKGNPRALRQHIASLRTRFGITQDQAERNTLQERIGKMLGGSATLWVAGLTKLETESCKTLATRTAAAMRGAMRAGVLPGGGVALRDCRPALQAKLAAAGDSEERAAYRILIRALDAPASTLLRNAGHDPGALLASIDHAGPGRGFDVLRGEIVEMRAAGLFDAADVLQAAVHGAVSTAALALTTDVMVHRRHLPVAQEP